MPRLPLHPEMRRKWTQLFKFVDVKKIGVLNLDNIQEVTRRMTANPRLTSAKRDELRTMFEDMYRVIIPNAEVAITLDEYLKKVTHMYQHKAGTMAHGYIKMYKRVFNSMDLNDDGHIDFEEFLIYHEAYGLMDKKAARCVFDRIDVDGNAEISQDEFVRAYLSYEMDADVKLEDCPCFGYPDTPE